MTHPGMIHLVNMPFTSVHSANLPTALLKAILTEAGLEARVWNLNMALAQRLGIGAYERVAVPRSWEMPFGEWLFAEQAWRRPLALGAESPEIGAPPDVQGVGDVGTWLRRVRDDVVPPFLDACIDKMQGFDTLRVVGFSCSFWQTIPSLALARRLKERVPDAKIMLGGPSVHGEMGDEIIRKAPWVDAVCTGEADDVIVPLAEALAAGQPPVGLPGVLFRDPTGTVRSGPPARPVANAVFDALPDPDYSDFFDDAKAAGVADRPSWSKGVYIPFESSRGCWWGEKHHCRFCGVCGEAMDYRVKSADRTYASLCAAANHYPGRRLRASDNNLSMKYFDTLMPKLAEAPLGPDAPIYYCTRPNLNRARMKALADAGVDAVQPGLESLSTHLLALMNKGTTQLQNLYYLKCAQEYGVAVFWNNLIGVPGERPEDYRAMAELVPKILHLTPPHAGSRRIMLYRFSPYLSEADRWVDQARPMAWYQSLYPTDQVDLSRVAYFFDGRLKDTLDPSAYHRIEAATLQWHGLWREASTLPRLVMHEQGDGTLAIEDTRTVDAGCWSLDAAESAVYRALSDPMGLQQVARQCPAIPPEAVAGLLDGFVDAGLAITESGRYLGLALPETAPVPPLELRRHQMVDVVDG